jgi:hypothetical protein
MVIQGADEVSNWAEWGCRPLSGIWPPVCVLYVPAVDDRAQPRQELDDAADRRGGV